VLEKIDNNNLGDEKAARNEAIRHL